jgi:hypothetical protein
MKKRSGFVSNSSSTSFVLALPSGLDVGNLEALHDYLYGPGEKMLGFDNAVELAGVSSRETTTAIARQLDYQTPDNDEVLFLLGCLEQGAPPNEHLDLLIQKQINPQEYERRDRSWRIACIEKGVRCLRTLSGLVLYRLEFNDWEGNELGDFLRNDPGNFGQAQSWSYPIG